RRGRDQACSGRLGDLLGCPMLNPLRAPASTAASQRIAGATVTTLAEYDRMRRPGSFPPRTDSTFRSVVSPTTPGRSGGARRAVRDWPDARHVRRQLEAH